MPSSTQNELQSEQNNSEATSIETIQPPLDIITRTIIESTARSVSKNGLELEKKIIASSTDPRFNFLRNTEDPCHGYYKRKLAEYSAQNQDDSTNEPNIKIFHAPKDVPTTSIVDTTARLVSKFGLEFEMMVKESNTDDERFNFLKSSEDPYHALYKQKLDEYASDPRDEYYQRKIAECYSPSRVQSQRLDLPNFLDCRVLEGMTLEELDTVKVTGQFVAWYGDVFRGKLMERVMMNHQFEFMKQTDYRFSFFNEFVVGYSQVLNPPKYLKDKLNNNAAYMTAILEAFLERILWDHVQELKWLDGGENSMIEWHNSASKDFVEDHELLPMLEMSPPAPLPPQKRPELDESALVPLEPEDQFLAQHEGLSIIRVICVPDGQVIKITVQSLSENVASLKEKIAEVVQIPANKHMLSGNRAVLKDNDRSLAYYNVKSGAILILDVV
ncbi:probable splicing factor 3A subunit 1 [Arabidopsis lyrata subsp. lyrata]|uniref:probable splicing factor 3A subunit 1 n=1 Tax=Arabidopsis lyrata subsp. lyrata TaxID=81972 RepID=UPI000A29E0C8|nr:probable splicing factor 3A subunit 1 [Arabidopsis lyrata subsp. lyrata]|eukprot:XP_020874899.1 probable splicing factor 3A subunit 1 [Arabidopsis lyrata subsp. lyrata]